MNSTELNTSYWLKVDPSFIPGNNVFPGKELFDLLPQGASVLDVGCGSGEMAELLSQKGYKVTAVDLNKDAIEINSTRNSTVTYLTADLTYKLPFDDSTFDCVVIAFVLVNMVPKDVRIKAVSELSRVLKSNGFLWINEGAVSEEYSHRYALCKPLINDDYSFFVFKDKSSSHLIQTEEQLAQAIKEDKIDRVAHHFTKEEFEELFDTSRFTTVFHRDDIVVSPRSGSRINAVTVIMQKS